MTSTKRLYRIGIALHDQWTPNRPEYPFHFSEPKVGDRVWVITHDTDTDDLAIEPDTIVDVADHYEMAKQQKEDGAAYYQDKDVLPPETYLIDFWLDKYNPGHGVSFGSEIFRSFDEAAFVLLQLYDDYDQYCDCLREIRIWRQQYGVTGFFDGS